MSIEVKPLVGTGATFALDEQERTEVEVLASYLAEVEPRLVDEPVWLAAARDLSSSLPVRLRQAMRRFARDPGQEGLLLLKNLPTRPELLPGTPTVAGSVQRASTLPAAVEVLVALQLGDLIAFQEEKSGALVQDVVPVPGMEQFQGNAGSVRLSLHVENAFHVNRPDYVGLHCLRADHDGFAGTEVASIRNALPRLSDEDRAVLHRPCFVTAPPASFGAMDGPPAPHAILSGDPEDPDVQVDFESTRPVGPEATRAMEALGDALAAVYRKVVLEPGHLVFLDNRIALHGRSAFEPRYDGRDRWLQRVFVHRDMRRSRSLRADDGYVISSRF
ncbi:TauD/TfdA family dioxygenase [Micromonospora sp. WMMD1082]|uniref:TauD/TfdA family dioxygenase n=1 Tax=Micromonospora sp. WMMD1082 TaxID=3016104 RepID=UPI00241805BE|nr:TauD/TfdA family dioxygenase [Micromonospora sp. WMMD1082]MDG4794557.1 TauD/TfdA family dioxygenase [Micromonospora sp. WMMD1082]